MSETIAFRALRYQWRWFLTVFLGLLLIAQIFRPSIAVISDVRRPEYAVADDTVGPSKKRESSRMSVEEMIIGTTLDQQRALIARTKLLIRKRDLETQIADARRHLEDFPQTKPAVIAARVPAMLQSPAPTVLGPEEINLLKSIEDQRTRLVLLKTSDTDLHPDVVEATERLTHMENQFVELRKGLDAKRPASAQAVPAPITTPAASTNNTSLQSQEIIRLTALLRAKNDVDARIRGLRNVASSVKSADPSLQVARPLLDGRIPVLQTMQIVPAASVATIRILPYETASVLLAVFFALLAASAREVFQDRVPGPRALQKELHDGAVFLGTIPRMRQS